MSLLNTPVQFGPLKLSNRLIMPPMATGKSDANGNVSQSILDFYDEKSRGGFISLFIIEHSYIDLKGKAGNNQLSAADDNNVSLLRNLADIIHNNGSKAVMQLNHAGSAAKEEIIGTTPVAPSAVMNPRQGDMPRELTAIEIKDLIEDFANAARRVKEAGFDGVEIHSAHGYLLNQFYSPLTNRRNDKYGGNILNRIQIHLEVIEAVRNVVGKDFPIFLRLGADDHIKGGTTIEDSLIAAKEFEKVGLDVLDISGGFSGYIIPGLTGQGFFAYLTEAIKKVVPIPLILTGGITEASAAEQLLVEGKADLIGVGRAVYKDSSWAKQAIESLD